MSPPAPADAPRLLIDRQALAHNWQLARQQSHTTLGAVLKNQAYGLGLEAVVPTLWALGCRDFWVSHVDEAEALQARLSDLEDAQDARIYVLNGLAGLPPRDWARHGWVPVLTGPHELPALQQAPDGTPALPVALHLDTGLSRVGFTAHDLPLLAPDSPLWLCARPRMWVSHLGRFHDPEATQCLAQRARFECWTRQLPPAARSIATSSSLFAGPAWGFDHARIGSALWGVPTSVRHAPPLQPVAGLQAPILRVSDLPAGAEVGYGGNYVTPGPRRIATVALGYGDGLPFSLANRGQLMLHGRAAPIVGGIAMGQLALDVSAYAPGQVQPGQWAEVYGRQQRLEALAAAAGVAPNVLLCLTARLTRQRLLEPLP